MKSFFSTFLIVSFIALLPAMIITIAALFGAFIHMDASIINPANWDMGSRVFAVFVYVVLEAWLIAGSIG